MSQHPMASGGSVVVGGQHPMVPVSALAGIFIISNAALGVGTLNFPEAFASSGGLAISIPLLILGALLCATSLSMCALANWESGTREFYQAVRFYMGTPSEVLFHVTALLAYLGTCTMYMVTVGDQCDKIIDRIVGKDEYCDRWYLQRVFTMPVLSTLVILPLCLAKSLDFLKYPSMLAVLSFVYMTVVIVADYAIDGPTEYAIIDKKPQSLVELFNAMPTIILGYQCMTNCYPIFGCFENPSVSKYVISIFGSVFIMSSIYLPVGTFGYLRNGRDVSGNILLDYNASDNKILVAQIAVLTAVMMSYPALFSVARVSIDKTWASIRKLFNSRSYTISTIGRSTWSRKYMTPVIFFLVTLVIAISIPNISIAASFTGSLATSFFFMFPGIFLIQSTYIDENHHFVYIQRNPSSKPLPVKKTTTSTFSTVRGTEIRSTTTNTFTTTEGPSARKNPSHLEVIKDQNDNYETAQIPPENQHCYFIRNKHKNGFLSWFLRFIGTVFCAFGCFILGMGITNASLSIHKKSVPYIQCN